MKYNALRAIASLVTFMIAMNFEMAVQSRSNLLVGLMIAFIALPFIRGKTHLRLGLTLLVDIAVVFALNYYSRFNINYLFILLNLWLLAEAALFQPFSRGLAISALTFAGAGLSFYQSLEYGMTYQALSQTVFIESVFILFSGMLFTYKSYLSKKEQVDALNKTLTEQNEILQETNENLQLSKEALESANLEVARLTRLKERSQFARDLHDTLGHELTGLMMSLEMLKLSADTKTIEALKSELQTSVNQSREILRAMRELVSDHKDIIIHDNLYDALSRKLYKYQMQTGIIVTFSYELFEERIDETMSDVLYRTVLEAITNTAKHSQAKKVWVSFQSLEDHLILLKILDDGGCISGFVKGNGLSFIEERIKRFGGQTWFECDPNGFRMTIKLSYKSQFPGGIL